MKRNTQKKERIEIYKKYDNKISLLVMMLVVSLAFSSLAGTVFVARVHAAYSEVYGVLDGAAFGVRFPDNWNGGLVLGCRGYSLTEPRANGTFFTGTAQAFLDVGFAFAASTYGSAGFCVQKGMNATYQLTKYLISTYRVTGKVFLYGLSMGGGIALLLGEKYPNVYNGVVDGYGTKDLKEQYVTKSRWANLSDAALTAELTALTIPVPPSGYANLTAFRAKCTSDVAEYILETGGTPTTKSKAYEDDSATYHANISIPVITIAGTSDALVPYYETLLYNSAVAKAGCSNLYRLYTIVGAEHGASVINQEARFTRFPELASWASTLQDWTMIVDNRGLKAYPDLKETVWQKNATMAPKGQYDKIGLHRLVKTGTTTKGVVFLLPASYGSGEQLTSNPPQSNYSIDESSNTAMYWANRGFDVYSIDYRAHFLPLTMNATEASALASNWGWDAYISDLKEAVEKAKQLSGSNKIFLAGISLGGNAAMYYASKYWKQDLKGIILLDASEQTAQSTNITNRSNVTSSLSGLNATGRLALEYPNTPGGTLPSGMLFVYQYALQNPSAPAEYPVGTPLPPTVNPLTNRTWTNITEYFTYQFVSTKFCNAYAGYSNIMANIQRGAVADRILPMRLFVENTALHDWNSCPFVSYDFDDYYKEINVPVLGFRSTLYGIPTYGNFTNGLATTDFTQITLPNYGHLDVVTGTYSAKDVSEPAYQWMLSHLSTLDVSAFSNARVFPGWTWNFFAQNMGGNAPYAYQWYEGLNPIQGQTSMVLPISKTSPGVYSFYCRVTDKDGTTTTSNAVTLTVIG